MDPALQSPSSPGSGSSPTLSSTSSPSSAAGNPNWGVSGKLKAISRSVFERAYGLNGRQREDHNALAEEIIAITQCSRKSFDELIYGHSYGSELADLRALVPGYKPKEPKKKPQTQQNPSQQSSSNISMTANDSFTEFIPGMRSVRQNPSPPHVGSHPHSHSHSMVHQPHNHTATQQFTQHSHPHHHHSLSHSHSHSPAPVSGSGISPHSHSRSAGQALNLSINPMNSLPQHSHTINASNPNQPLNMSMNPINSLNQLNLNPHAHFNANSSHSNNFYSHSQSAAIQQNILNLLNQSGPAANTNGNGNMNVGNNGNVAGLGGSSGGGSVWNPSRDPELILHSSSPTAALRTLQSKTVPMAVQPNRAVFQQNPFANTAKSIFPPTNAPATNELMVNNAASAGAQSSIASRIPSANASNSVAPSASSSFSGLLPKLGQEAAPKASNPASQITGAEQTAARPAAANTAASSENQPLKLTPSIPAPNGIESEAKPSQTQESKPKQVEPTEQPKQAEPAAQTETETAKPSASASPQSSEPQAPEPPAKIEPPVVVQAAVSSAVAAASQPAPVASPTPAPAPSAPAATVPKKLPKSSLPAPPTVSSSLSASDSHKSSDSSAPRLEHPPFQIHAIYPSLSQSHSHSLPFSFLFPQSSNALLHALIVVGAAAAFGFLTSPLSSLFPFFPESASLTPLSPYFLFFPSIFLLIALFYLNTLHSEHASSHSLAHLLHHSLQEYTDSWEFLALEDPEQYLTALQQIDSLAHSMLRLFHHYPSDTPISSLISTGIPTIHLPHAAFLPIHEILDYFHSAHCNLIAELGSSEWISSLTRALRSIRTGVQQWANRLYTDSAHKWRLTLRFTLYSAIYMEFLLIFTQFQRFPAALDQLTLQFPHFLVLFLLYFTLEYVPSAFAIPTHGFHRFLVEIKQKMENTRRLVAEMAEINGDQEDEQETEEIDGDAEDVQQDNEEEEENNEQ